MAIVVSISTSVRNLFIFSNALILIISYEFDIQFSDQNKSEKKDITSSNAATFFSLMKKYGVVQISQSGYLYEPDPLAAAPEHPLQAHFHTLEH